MNCKNSVQNALKVAIFRLKIEKFSGERQCPQTPPPLNPIPSAPRYSRLRRSATRRLDPRTVDLGPTVCKSWIRHCTKIHFVGRPNRRITNPRRRTTAILKNRKRPYLHNALTDLHQIWHDDAFWPSEGYGQLKLSKSNMADGRHLEKSINGHISGTA